VHDFRDSQPVVDRLLHPIGQGNRADVSSFPDQVNDGPMVFAALNMVKGQINEFSSTEPTRLPSMGTGTNIVMASCADSGFVAHSTLWQLQAKRRNRKGGQPPKFSKFC